MTGNNLIYGVDLFHSPAGILPVSRPQGGYSSNSQLNISQLPAGNYRCAVRISHGAYITNSSNEDTGVAHLFNYIIQTGDWAIGNVNVTINLM